MSGKSAPVRILLIEDNPGDARLLEMHLRSTSISFDLTHSSSLADGVQNAEQFPFDLLLLDLSLSDSFGLATLRKMRSAAKHLAIVVLTATSNASVAMQSLQAGAQDYLNKDELNSHTLERCLRYSLERQRLQRRDEERSEQLARSNAELDKFASIASHDLQEPLRKIIAFGDRLRETCGEVLGPEGSDYLDRMQGAAERMRRLIDSLLQFSRFSYQPPAMSKVNLNNTIQEAISNLDYCMEQSRARVDSEPLPTVLGDPSQLVQLFQNLIANGIKYCPEGVTPVVRICSWRADDSDEPSPCDCIAIQDNGIGIDEKFHGRIFEPFQRLHAREQFDGTGMGLTICKRIAELHGGRIELESRPGEGSAFIVRLPSAVATARAETPAASRQAIPSTISTEKAP